MLIAVLLMPLALLGGCTGLPAQSQEPPAEQAAKGLAPHQARELHLGLVRQMLEKRLYYAALAHLDSAPAYARDPEARWLRAEALRHTDRGAQARRLYRELAAGVGPLAAQAERGLGLLAAREQDLEQALVHLQRARELAPTDARICNDLGYALLLSGRLEPARRQLATALELGDQRPRTARNLALVLLAQGQAAAAERLARQRGIDERELEALRRRVEAIRRGWPGGEPS